MRATVSIALGMMLVACGGTASEENASRISQRIVGGSQSTSAQDSTVYLSIGEDGSCTGTLVTPNLVLTARHCVSEYGWGGSEQCGEFTYDLPASMTRVHLGVDALYAAPAAWGKKIHRPAGNDGCDDIALVELATPITQVKPAVVRFTTPTVGEPTTAVGYGENGHGWIRDERWQRANLPLQGIGPTSFVYVTRHGWSIPVDLPAKTIATGESTCYGDSGGPLFDATGAVIGVTSRGIDEHCVDRPTLYTSTASFETLIRSAATAAGHPLAGDVAPEPPVPTETDPDPDSRIEKSTKSTDDEYSESEGLDEPTAEEPVAGASSCNASPKHATSSSAVAAFALAAAIAIVARRKLARKKRTKPKPAAAVALPLVASLVLVGCSSTPPYDGTPLSGSPISDDDDMGEDDLSGAAIPAPDDTSAKAQGACGGESSQAACFECCNEKAPQAVDVYTGALEACLCESPGACQAACASTLCSGYKADSTCAACLRDAGQSCEDTAFTKCESDPACKGLLDCASESRCSSK